MTIQQLQYALALQKYQSFSIAATHMQISQPALSAQVNKLEKELDLLLFDRASNPIKPTLEGAQFLDRAFELTNQATALKDFALTISDGLSGRIKIGIIPTLAPFLVPLFAYTFQEKFDSIALDINEMITEKVVNGVKQGSLDVGIISTPITVNGVESIPLFYEKFYLYTANNIPLKQRTLSTLDYSKLWLLEEGNCFRDQLNDFCNVSKIREHKDFIYRSNSIDALIRIVDSKGGMTILPELTTLILNEEQEDNTSIISGKLPKAREVGLIKRGKTNKEALITELMQHIRMSIPKPMLSSEKLEIVDPHIDL